MSAVSRGAHLARRPRKQSGIPRRKFLSHHSSLTERKREREKEDSCVKILRDKIAKKFDGIVVNARNCGTKERDLSCKSRLYLGGTRYGYGSLITHDYEA